MNDVRIEIGPCLKCGACCRRPWGIKAADEWVPKCLTMIAFDGEAGVDGVFMRQHGDGSCIAFNSENNRCAIYERRPMVCRDFKRMSAQCVDAVLEFRPEFVKGLPPSELKNLGKRGTSG